MLARSDWSSVEPLVYVRRQRVVTMAERVWIVRETDTSLNPDAPGDHCLLCECALAVRRVWSYPRDWAHLSDGELLELFA